MPTTADRVIVEDALLLTLHAAGFGELTPEGLVTPSFPDTFAASAFHTQIVNAMTLRVGTGRRAGVEWVFRHVDAEKVGYSAAHLSLFRMLVYFDASLSDARVLRLEAVERFLALTALLGLRRDHVTVTYFGGGTIGGRTLPPDVMFADAWLDAGIPRHRIIPVPGRTNFTNIRRAGEPAGPRCEVYYDIPGLPGGLEIGTVVCEEYILDADGHPSPAGLSVCGGAFGVERLEMCARGLSTISEIETVDHLVALLLREAPPHAETVFRVPAIRIVNGLRALAIIASYTGRDGANGRSARVRALVRDVLRAARESGITLAERVVRRFVTSIDLYEAASASHARACADTIVTWLERAAVRDT